MKVVVTGGSGQLGSLVLTRLAAAPVVRGILSLDLVPPRVADAKLAYRIADMRDPGLERHFEGVDALVHLAFVISGARTVEAMRSANVDGTRRVLEAATRHGVRRIVVASSVAAYGLVHGQPDPIVEDTPRHRTGKLAYADHKFEVEEVLDRYESEHPDVAVVRLRPGVLVGRRISHVSDRLTRRRIWPVLSNVRVPVVWDDDVAEACGLALEAGVRGAFNLVAEPSLTAEALAREAGFRVLRVSPSFGERALSALGRGGDPRGDAGWVGIADVELSVSAERARTVLGWKPRYPTARDVAQAFGGEAPRGTDPRLRALMRVLGSTLRRETRGDDPGDRDAESAAADAPPPEALEVHLEVGGLWGGDYTLSEKGGRLDVVRGIPRPPDATLGVDVATLVALLRGELSIADAEVEGRLRVRGDARAPRLLEDVVRVHRRSVEERDLRGRLSRRLTGWLGTSGNA